MHPRRRNAIVISTQGPLVPIILATLDAFLVWDQPGEAAGLDEKLGSDQI